MTEETKTDSRFSSLTILLFIALGLLLGVLWMQNCRGVKVGKNQGINLVNSLNDSLNTYKDKDKRNVARISVLELDKNDDFKSLQVKDGALKELQDLVSAYKDKLTVGNSVTLALLETLNKGTTPTVITLHDTVSIPNPSDLTDGIKYIYPTYTTKDSSEFLEYMATMNKDTSTYSIKVKNKYAVVIGRDKKTGLFADVTSYNPYTETKAVRAFMVSTPKPKKFGIGPSVGATFYNSHVNPYVGIGIHWNLIRF